MQSRSMSKSRQLSVPTHEEPERLASKSKSTESNKDIELVEKLRLEELQRAEDIQMAHRMQEQLNFENESLARQRRELEKFIQETFHCDICMDDLPRDDVIRIEGCGHETCRGCMMGYIGSKLEEHRFPILCPICVGKEKGEEPNRKWSYEFSE